MTSELRIIDGVEEAHLTDVLLILYDAFVAPFRIGFSGPGDFVRLFQDGVNPSSCLTALLEGQLIGILSFQTADQDFFKPKMGALVTRFWPWRALRIFLNLLVIDESAKPREFIVANIAVSPSSRGLGVGTALMNAAEDRARSAGKRLLSLDVSAENDGARRLYERLGYRVTATQRGFLVRFVAGDSALHRMEKPLSD